MKIKAIYERYGIPLNLQDHMVKVAAVGEYLADHWKNPDEMDKQSLIAALLLHDMGNVIKFDLKNPHLHKDPKEISHLIKIQKEFIKRYGTDENKASVDIARELKVSSKIQNLIHTGSQSSTHDAVTSSDANRKIRGYADLRVGPSGIVSIKERFDDILIRYKDTIHKLSNRRNVEDRLRWAYELERQIQSMVTVNIHAMNDETIKGIADRLRISDIHTDEN